MEGYTGDVYCKACGMMLRNGSKVSKEDHSLDSGTVTTQATCTEEGVKTFTCINNCGETATESIPATGHIWNDGETTKESTCTQPGEKTYTCTFCGETKTEAIEATGHSTETVIKNEKKATCTQTGYSGDVYCKVCGELIQKGQTVSKVSHSWDTGKVTTKATIAKAGVKTYTCRTCKTTKTEAIKALGLKKGTVIKDTKSNGVYTATGTGTYLQYTKPINAKAQSVTIPAAITYQGASCRVTSIAVNAFKNNAYLKTVKIGDYVTVVGSNSFYNCTKLTTVTLGQRVKTIGINTFARCTSLTKISIPSSVGTIGKQAFYGCKNLKSITIRSTTLNSKTVGENAFKGIYAKANVAVPKAKLSYYKKLLYIRGIGSKINYKTF
jgi:hypothetical protein